MNLEDQLGIIKTWYRKNYSLCLFCGHKVRGNGDLAHIIRRTYSTRFLTLKLNTGLAHRECHELYDNNPSQAQYLPRIIEVLFIAWLLEPEYLYQIADSFPELFSVFEQFPNVNTEEMSELTHHGELLSLQYLVK